MNRFQRYSIYASMSFMIIALTLLGQRLLLVPSVYGSILQIGERVGSVLPHGLNTESHLPSLQSAEIPVTWIPEPTVKTVYSGMHPNDPGALLPKYRATDMRVPMLAAVSYICALFLVSTVSMWKRNKTDFRTISLARFTGILGIGSGVCVLIATIYSASRVFWTGVDQSFYNRSIMKVVDSSSIHINGNQLLAMSSRELTMLLIAMVMTVLPILLWIDTKLFRPTRVERIDSARGYVPVSLSHLYKLGIIEEILRIPFRRTSLICYVSIAVFLWSAPWSTTIVHAVLN